MSTAVRSYIMATAGHVDHGKSSLVRALTGTDPDRLPGEKARGMTIDLGFAHLDLTAPSPVRSASAPSPSGRGCALSEAKRAGDGDAHVLRLGIIDVPGHEDFVKNMVAGVGSIDLALLVVAADDGWMPQTEEHLQILSYLGVSRGVVAITKIDRAADEPAVIESVRQRLRASFLEAAPLVPTSILRGRGLDDLREALARVVADAPAQPDIGKPRLPVDRAFSLAGVGTVVTGTLSGGCLRTGAQVLVFPASAAARVRSIQSYGESVGKAQPGSRVALNLAGLRAGRDAGETGSVTRGDVVALFGEASCTLDVALWRIRREAPRDPSERRAARPSGNLRNGLRVLVHHASTMVPARLMLAEPALPPGGQAIAQLRLQRPVLAFGGDRFVIRDASGRQTLAGGLVLDPHGARPNWRSAARLALLADRAKAPSDATVWVRTQVAARQIVLAAGLLRQTRFSDAQIEAAVQATITASPAPAVLRSGLLIDTALWRRALERLSGAVDAFHREQPQLAGMPLSRASDVLGDLPQAPRSPHISPASDHSRAGDSSTSTGPVQLREALARAAIDELVSRATHVRDSATLRARAHAPALPPRLHAAGERIRQTLSADPLNPPSRRQLAPDAQSEQALRYLISSGQALELGPDCILSAHAMSRAIEIIRAQLAGGRQATVSQLRQALGSSRRIVVPLLERLDQQGLTRRSGDSRRLA